MRIDLIVDQWGCVFESVLPAKYDLTLTLFCSNVQSDALLWRRTLYHTHAEISSIQIPSGYLKQHAQSITLQYLAYWQGREGGSWQAWTSVDRSAAPPWKAPLNALEKGEKARAQVVDHLAGSVDENLKVHAGRERGRWREKPVFFWCLNVQLSM